MLIIVARICWGVQRHMQAAMRKFFKCGAAWCILVYILIRLCLEKFPKNLLIFV